MSEDLATDERVNSLAAEFVQHCMNGWSKKDLPQEPMARAFVTHGAIMVSAIVGPKHCAAELRKMADEIELGQAPIAGRG